MSLRILQIASGLPRWAGTEKHVLDISTVLAGRGHFVTLACPGKSVLAQRAELAGLRSISIEMRSGYDWTQLPAFMRLMREGYDIAHIHSPLDYVVPAVAARIGRIPAVVMTRHMPYPFASRCSAYIASSVLCDRIIAVSGFMRTLLVQSGARNERVDVVPNGIVSASPNPDSGYHLRDALEIPRDAILIAAAGRMSPGKGFHVLLRALARLNSGPDAIYCAIFGAGQVLEELRVLSADLRLGSRVRLPGFRDDIHDLWCAADIAVIPSVEPESFSYAALEALSAGCAVIASRVGGLPEVLSLDSAILTEPGDVAGVADAIRDLIASADLRRRLQQAARERAKAFTLDASVTGIEKVYANVLGRRPRIAAGPVRRLEE